MTLSTSCYYLNRGETAGSLYLSRWYSFLAWYSGPGGRRLYGINSLRDTFTAYKIRLMQEGSLQGHGPRGAPLGPSAAIRLD